MLNDTPTSAMTGSTGPQKEEKEVAPSCRKNPAFSQKTNAYVPTTTINPAFKNLTLINSPPPEVDLRTDFLLLQSLAIE